ncbi:metal transporter [Flavicella sp.]|uniref:heavy-metal-associated domain-containing protein n=1 Tax=Flavicella sp. TaxID=2957742 RepID=UPI002602FB60|nr:metal transporter [Flavicella sp.]MDG1806165.1 metal transporter [Flavicella sp.]MDG2279676.1 metal transporter [Flavicella sp.]
MKKIILILLVAFSYGVSAQEVQEKSKKKKIALSVNGNCEMCKARIEKSCLKTTGVKYAQWDVNSKQLNLIFNEYKTSKDEIQQSILMVGHDVDSLTANTDSYKELHTCCQYRED